MTIASLPDAQLEQRAGVAFQAGAWNEAILAWRELSRRYPGAAGPLFMLGASFHGAGQAKEALSAFLAALAIDPQAHQAHLAAATLYAELGRHAEALAHCRQAIALEPSDPRAHTNAAIACEALGQPVEALAAYDQALQIDRTWADALKNRGALLLSLERIDEAVAAAKNFVFLHPQRADAYFQLGEACLAAHRPAEAVAAFTTARPGFPDHDIKPLLFAGFAEAQQQNFAKAQALLDLAWQKNSATVLEYRQKIFSTGAIGSGPLNARTLYLLATYDRAEACDWRHETDLPAIWNKVLADNDLPTDRPLGFRAMTLGVDQNHQLRLARRIADQFPAQPLPPIAPRSTTARLRIGYLSPDFRNHAVGSLTSKLFGWHDRSRVEVFTYSIGPATDDPIRRQIREGSDCFRDLRELSDQQAAACLQADQLDVLIDLAGYTDYARPGIFALRPAPLQVSWMGYLTTMGAAWMDYIVLDPLTAPTGAEHCYSEAIIRLPESMRFCAYANDFPATLPSRQQAGLPAHGRVLAAFHNGYKIEPGVFSLWMRLLAAAPDAILWLLDGDPAMLGNLRREATQRGLDPQRLVFAPRRPLPEHIARFGLADLFLDTFRCNGGTTVCDALVAGVPVLTCAGAGYAQRMAASNLQAAGFTQGITHSAEEYEATARTWLARPETLADLRRQLLAQRGHASFYRPQQWVRQFEDALLMATQRQRAGLPPASFALPA